MSIHTQLAGAIISIIALWAMGLQMAPSNYIQLAGAIISAVALCAILRQLVVQNRIFKAQMLRDRFDMYWKTVEPVSDDSVRQLRLCPEDYMDRSLYESHYKANADALRKYIYMLQLYEYLAFTYGLKQYKLPDPLGYTWAEMWTRDLLAESEFLEVHRYHKPYYPYFAAYVDGLLQATKSKPIP